MAISKVWLNEKDNECISCGACESICPAVFEVPYKMIVKDGVNLSSYEAEIIDAADSCPTQVISFEKTK
jgi:ferredoxin